MKRENRTIHVSLVVVGGGPAGLAAAIRCREQGIEDLLILERGPRLGGILRQCVHSGFGVHKFNEELIGPEYADRYIDRVRELGIPYRCDTMVTDISADHVVTCVSEEHGLTRIKAGAVILAMGCRERSRGAVRIPGTRPAGVYTAGTAQLFVNLKGYMPGKRVVVLGSGDIGLIMARRMRLEGAEVKAVLELMPYSGGLKRNIVQCLEDFDIPLLLSHTVTEIHGENRLTGVTIARVDENLRPIEETKEFIDCDTLLLSVGLIPENELARAAGVELDPVTGGAVVDEHRETSVGGIFSCGNVLHVHDLVDYVSEEAEIAGESAALYLKGELPRRQTVAARAGNGVRYVVPQRISGGGEELRLFFRPDQVCRGAMISVSSGGELLRVRNRRIVTPGEMESIVLKEEELRRVHGDITIEVGLKS